MRTRAGPHQVIKRISRYGPSWPQTPATRTSTPPWCLTPLLVGLRPPSGGFPLRGGTLRTIGLRPLLAGTSTWNCRLGVANGYLMFEVLLHDMPIPDTTFPAPTTRRTSHPPLSHGHVCFRCFGGHPAGGFARSPFQRLSLSYSCLHSQAADGTETQLRWRDSIARPQLPRR